MHDPLGRRHDLQGSPDKQPSQSATISLSELALHRARTTACAATLHYPRKTDHRRPEMRLAEASPSKPAGAEHTDAKARSLTRGERWFAAQSQPHRESLAANHLRNQGFHVFLPLRLKTWRHARRIETRVVSFFPGYLFVVLNLDRDRWRSVNGTVGVQRLVTSGAQTRPTPVPVGIVEALIADADERGCLRPANALRVGEEVRILSGPFGDRMGELIALDDAGRVRVLVELLGGRIPAILSRGQVLAGH